MITAKSNSPLTIVLCACTILFASDALGLEVSISVSPSTLNLGSSGTPITCTVTLPTPYVASDVVSVSLEGVSPYSSTGGGGTLTCKFDRETFETMLIPFAPGEVELNLFGEFTDGIEFEGMDTMFVKFSNVMVTSSAGANGSINPAGETTVTYGSNLAFTATPGTGYQVDTWSVDGSVVQTGGTSYTQTDIQAAHTVEVTFRLLEYVIASSAGANGSISPAGETTVTYGSNLAFTATPGTGYQVDAWSVDGSVVQTGGTSYTLTDIQAVHTVEVTFRLLEYVVASSAGANGSISPAGETTVTYGSNLAFTATPGTGYQVDTWSVDGSVVQTGGTSYTLTDIQAAHTVEVTFRLLEYVVASSAGANGSISPAGETTVTYGSNLAFTATPGTGYQVDTWSVDGSVVQTGGTSYTLTDIQAVHTVEVTFRLLEYVVASSAGANGSISPAGETTVTYGSNLAFTATPGTGYQVDTWSVDGSVVQTGGTSYTLTDIQAVHTVEVTFRLLEYVVASSAGANGSISPAGETTVTYGSNLAFTATPGTGYQVDTWSVDGSVVQTGGTSYTLTDIQAAHTVEVTFRLLEYVVASSAGANGSISPAGETTVTYGSNLAFTATPGTGYQVDTWSVDGSVVQTGGTSYTLTDIQAAHTVEVTFRLLEYVVASSAGANGSISPAGETTVTYGSNLAFTATPGTGYQVDAWSVDGSVVQTGGTSYTLTDIQAAHTVEVTFRLLEYVVASSAGANGSISPAGETTVTYGSNLAFTATPGTGYQVDAWSVDGSVVQTGGTSYTLTDIQAAHTVEVTFRLLEYVVASSAGANGSISPASETTVTYGSNLAFTAIPGTGYQVDTWSVDGSVVQTGGASYTLTDIQAVHTVEVTFRLLEYVVVSSAGANGSISPAGETTVTYGSNLAFTATPTTGWEVTTWTVDGSLAQTGGISFTLTNIVAPHTVEVSFSQIQYTITALSEAHGTIIPAGAVIVTHGSDQAFTATPATGWEVATWTVDGSLAQTGGTSFTLTNIVAPHTVEVSFSQIQYTITALSGAHGTIIPAGAVIVTHGSDQAFTATPETGWEVATWTVDGSLAQTGGTGFTLTNIVAPHTVEVSFSQIQYTITALSGAHGTIIPAGAVIVTHGSDQAFTATPETGWEVATWIVDGSLAQTGGTGFTLTNIVAPHTVEVSFSQIQYTITALSEAHGTIIPAGAVIVTHGSDQAFTATPETGWEVATWTVDGSLAQTGGTGFTLTNIVAPHTIEVIFKQNEYNITATTGPNGMVIPMGATISPGGEEQFTAIPNTGYTVDMWYLDNDLAKIGGTNFQLTDIQSDHTVHVTFRQALAYLLGEPIEFEEEEEVEERILNNNVDPDEPDKALVVIEQVGFGPGSDNAVMGMRSQKDLDPTSPNYGRLVNARAKGIFVKTDADKILIRFKYLFLTSDPDVKIVVYLSDSPELLAPDDPLRQQHYLECAQIPNPPFPRPGAAGTDRFAVFQKIVWTGHLNFTEGVYIELELIEPDTSGLLFASSMSRVSADSGDSSVFIDDWSPAVQCYGICMDINWDNFVDEADFLMVIGGTGCGATGENACLDGAFSGDGYVDSYDAVSWDWALNSDVRLLNFCGVPLTSGGGSVSMMSTVAAGFKSFATARPRVNFADSDLSDLLIAGKTSEMNAPSKLRDSLYVFNNEGQFNGSFEPASNRCNIRLVQGSGGEIYQLNSETGLLRLNSTNEVIVPPGEITLSDITEPRYNKSAMVYIGIQDKDQDSFGRPILDAAFDAEYVYVVPVVVNPDGEDPYTAAAKLKLLNGATSPYEIVQLYDDSPLPNDNQYRNYLREVEIDNSGNVYILNVHAINESDILWRYKPDGTVERIDLGRPDSDSYVPAPVGMYMSKTTDMLYLTSAAYNPADPDSTVVYGFSTNGDMALERSVTISDLQHITGITEDPQTGTLWIAGFNMYDIPLYPNPYQMAFYYPFLAKIPNGSDTAELLPLYEPDSHDLALPMSILWTGSAGHN